MEPKPPIHRLSAIGAVRSEFLSCVGLGKEYFFVPCKKKPGGGEGGLDTAWGEAGCVCCHAFGEQIFFKACRPTVTKGVTRSRSSTVARHDRTVCGDLNTGQLLPDERVPVGHVEHASDLSSGVEVGSLREVVVEVDGSAEVDCSLDQEFVEFIPRDRVVVLGVVLPVALSRESG